MQSACNLRGHAAVVQKSPIHLREAWCVAQSVSRGVACAVCTAHVRDVAIL
jgi:hypothetical protein